MHPDCGGASRQGRGGAGGRPRRGSRHFLGRRPRSAWRPTRGTVGPPPLGGEVPRGGGPCGTCAVGDRAGPGAGPPSRGEAAPGPGGGRPLARGCQRRRPAVDRAQEVDRALSPGLEPPLREGDPRVGPRGAASSSGGGSGGAPGGACAVGGRRVRGRGRLSGEATPGLWGAAAPWGTGRPGGRRRGRAGPGGGPPRGEAAQEEGRPNGAGLRPRFGGRPHGKGAAPGRGGPAPWEDGVARGWPSLGRKGWPGVGRPLGGRGDPGGRPRDEGPAGEVGPPPRGGRGRPREGKVSSAGWCPAWPSSSGLAVPDDLQLHRRFGRRSWICPTSDVALFTGVAVDADHRVAGLAARPSSAAAAVGHRWRPPPALTLGAVDLDGPRTGRPRGRRAAPRRRRPAGRPPHLASSIGMAKPRPMLPGLAADAAPRRRSRS